MKKLEKRTHVIFADTRVKKSFDKLKTDKFESQKLYDFIMRAVEDLKKEPSCGISIPKKLIPKEYIRKYGITNLWKYNLPNAWRLVYTIQEDEVTIISVLLEWFNHKNYEMRFKY